MAEYIKKALVAREIRKLLRVRESAVDIFQAGFEYGVDKAWANINKIPAADVASVVHGRWRKSKEGVCGDYLFVCSACGADYWESPSFYKQAHYCPNCGAKMDEEAVK